MKNKKLRTGIIVGALVAAVGIGGTLAYFTSVTNTAENTFTMGEGITGTTEEPGWMPENGENFAPGKVIVKDPIIRNTSAAGTDAIYAGAAIEYQMKDANGTFVTCTYADLDKFINIRNNNAGGFNTADWTMNADNTRAYYTKEKVQAQSATSPLFTAVEIDKLALTPDQILSATTPGAIPQFDVTKYEESDSEGNLIVTYTNYEMKDFKIIVTGYLVQGSNEFTSCQNAMTTAFPDVFQ